MRLPRDLGGEDLVKILSGFGYIVTRQTGSHIRLSRSIHEGTHQITVPRHRALRVGTLNAILNEVSEILKIPKEEILKKK